MKIVFVSPIEEIDRDDDNVDVHVHLEDGTIYSFLVATPNNIYRSMSREGVEFYFGTPPLFVREITAESVELALRALFSEEGGRWVKVYGALQ